MHCMYSYSYSCSIVGDLCENATAEMFLQAELCQRLNTAFLLNLPGLPHFHLRCFLRHLLRPLVSSFSQRFYVPQLSTSPAASAAAVSNGGQSQAAAGSGGSYELEARICNEFFVPLVYNCCYFFLVHVHPDWLKLRTQYLYMYSCILLYYKITFYSSRLRHLQRSESSRERMRCIRERPMRSAEATSWKRRKSFARRRSDSSPATWQMFSVCCASLCCAVRRFRPGAFRFIFCSILNVYFYNWHHYINETRCCAHPEARASREQSAADH